MSRLKELSERFGYLAGLAEWSEDLAKMDKKLDTFDDLTTALLECGEALVKAKAQIVTRHGQSFSAEHSTTCATCDALVIINNALSHARKLLKESEGS